ncbi:MAG TPA: aminotransferase class I/II-fold pyridoxal phosphate-dependent enzyme [Ktedonobacterales bacterium]|jgi:histidinol-phosphate aminotransferase|nr:aminotransferase class I/II-fold pyridoxal phosphate-dependent enzyme [Ktedonobacterales bacterium]
MSSQVSVTRLVAALPATVPFVAPEALERTSGRPFRLRLGANESTFGPSPSARNAMLAAVNRVSYYADPECHELRAAVAAYHGLGMEHVVVASGIDELLGLVVRAYVDRDEPAVTSLGAYPTFAYHVTGFGGRLVRVPYLDDRNDLEGLAAAAHDVGARLVYLANPDNPTGSWYTADEILAFVERLPDDALLILDEAYAEFATQEIPLPSDALDPRIIRMRTFSKVYGMAGARIGYAIATPGIRATFDKIRLHFGVNLVAQAGALASLADADFLASVTAAVAEGRAEYAALAAELGLTALPSATNFVTIDVGGPERARALVAALAERGVFIRMPGAPPLDRCVRVTVGTPSERALLAEILRETWPEVAAASV